MVISDSNASLTSHWSVFKHSFFVGGGVFAVVLYAENQNAIQTWSEAAWKTCADVKRRENIWSRALPELLELPQKARESYFPKSLISGQLKAVVLKAWSVQEHHPTEGLKPLWRHSCLCRTAAGAGRMLLPFYWGNGSAAPPAAEWFTLQITNAIMCCNENVLRTVTTQRVFKDWNGWKGEHWGPIEKQSFRVTCIFSQVNF